MVQISHCLYKSQKDLKGGTHWELAFAPKEFENVLDSDGSS